MAMAETADPWAGLDGLDDALEDLSEVDLSSVTASDDEPSAEVNGHNTAGS